MGGAREVSGNPGLWADQRGGIFTHFTIGCREQKQADDDRPHLRRDFAAGGVEKSLQPSRTAKIGHFWPFEPQIRPERPLRHLRRLYEKWTGIDK